MLPVGLRRGRPHLPRVPERATIYLPLLPEGQGSGVPSPAPCQDLEAAGLLCACNCWADHSDDTTGGKSLPARSVFLTVILCPGTNDISPPPTRARGLPIQRERFLCVNNHFLDSQCSLLLRGRRKTVVALFIPIPHTRIRLECSRRGEGTLLVLLLKDPEPTYHAESECSLRRRHPPMTRRLTRALTFYWLRMAHSWGAFPSPFSGPPSLGDCHSTALGQSGELPGGGLPVSSSPSPPVPRPPRPHPSPLPAGL